ncbi:BatD family protein [Legionella cardiaca]|uniref:BatD family protein n=1 Tax=Legionella cardiaca TaxID=1071983 RepID=A0ABY8ATE3_9GAMM|nr:BatD family protein [Legionella cardiaca]WED43044.1 BatD family protein [Legionella cardiaca]
MKKILLSLFLLGCYGLGFATVTMQLESSQVQADETFRLILTLEGEEIDSVPDLSPLQKDFTIVGTERSMNYTLVNGRASSVSQWLVLLTPKKTGTLTIPAIQVGQTKTNPANVEVTDEAPDSKQVDTEKQQDVMLTTEISEKNPYINQQVIYTVKLYSSRRMVNTDYQPPQVENALLIPLGAGRRYQTAEKGRIYVVDEQQYAIFPQKSGSLKIIPPTFRAVIYDVVPRHVNERGNSMLIQVRPIPPHLNKNWLPAKQVTLSETYDNNNLSLQQGSTIVRTVTLRARGVPAQLLPPLDFGNSTEFSIYPEKPSERNVFKEPDLVGSTTVKVTYLFNKAGQITIPALNLTWFNTTTAREETISLPEHTVQVIASATAPQAAVKSPPAQFTVSPKEETILPTKTKENASVKTTTNPAWWVAGVFALAWLLTLGLWFWQRSTRNSKQTSKQILRRLKEACLQNNASMARDTLLQWAQNLWPQANILNLIDVEHRVDDEALKEQIKKLSQALYNNNGQKWQGEALWNRILAFRQNKKMTPGQAQSLPPMHKL